MKETQVPEDSESHLEAMSSAEDNWSMTSSKKGRVKSTTTSPKSSPSSKVGEGNRFDPIMIREEPPSIKKAENLYSLKHDDNKGTQRLHYPSSTVMENYPQPRRCGSREEVITEVNRALGIMGLQDENVVCPLDEYVATSVEGKFEAFPCRPIMVVKQLV